MAGIRQTRFLLALSIEIDPNENDRLRIVGSIPGFFLAGDDHDAVWRDLGPALQIMLRRNYEFPKMEPGFKELLRNNGFVPPETE